jgi:leucyl-tRNA synthetase
VHIAPDSDRAAIVATAKALPAVQAQLAGTTIRKVIVVPNRLVNFVVSYRGGQNG